MTPSSHLLYDGPSVLHANQLFRATLTVKLGVSVKTGGRVVIATRHVSDFGDPQMTDPAAENYSVKHYKARSSRTRGRAPGDKAESRGGRRGWEMLKASEQE